MADIELFNTLTYDTVKTSLISDISDVYTNISTLETGDNESGIYIYGFSLSFNYSSTTNSVFIHWRIDGGGWAEFALEPKDITNSIPVYYAYPKAYTSGVHTIEIEMRKESSAGTLNLEVCDSFFQRVGV